MIEEKDLTLIGKFMRTHALKGELNAMTEIDDDYFTDDNPLIVDVDGIYVPFYCESIRPKGHYASLIKLIGVDSEDEAAAFVNKDIYGLTKDVEHYLDEEVAEDGAYADSFIGYSMIDNEAGEIGEITDIDLSTDNALFIVTDGDDTIFIPIADEFIREIDNENKILHVDLPQGLVDLN